MNIRNIPSKVLVPALVLSAFLLVGCGKEEAKPAPQPPPAPAQPAPQSQPQGGPTQRNPQQEGLTGCLDYQGWKMYCNYSTCRVLGKTADYDQNCRPSQAYLERRRNEGFGRFRGPYVGCDFYSGVGCDIGYGNGYGNGYGYGYGGGYDHDYDYDFGFCMGGFC
ncbi:MAG: hypothetical protein HY537_15180 [Deltaproteobacteria bacterium]|nr:hypothetical protein [Deltaproteobacteria bacterium]